MKLIVSKKAKKKKKPDGKLHTYWSNIYPGTYSDALTASKKLDVKLKGTLRQQDDGFTYLDLSNNIIHGIYALIDDEDKDKPPYFGSDGIGAHVSVISSDEGKQLKEKNVKIEEIGQEFHFELAKFKSTNPASWDEMKRVWFVELEAPELKKLRGKYGLPKTYNGMGHNFHITVAVQKK